MEIVVICALALNALLAIALVIRERDHDQALTDQTLLYAKERRELLNRIQRPDLLPIHPDNGPRNPVPPPRDAAELNRVGTVFNLPQPRPDGEPVA